MTAGEFLCRRDLASDELGYTPGQHEARILDPRPHRDRADLAAILTYVDDDGKACDVMCLRYRDERGWRSIKVKRATLRRLEPTSVATCPPLEGVLLEVVERAAEGVEPYPFEEPSEEELGMRRLAHKLVDQVIGDA